MWNAVVRCHSRRRIGTKRGGDYDWFISSEVGAEAANKRRCTFKLHASTLTTVAERQNGFWTWLSDAPRGALTSVAPSTWTWRQSASRVLLRSVSAKKLYLAVTSSTGLCSVEFGYAGAHKWYVNYVACNGLVKCNSVEFS